VSSPRAEEWRAKTRMTVTTPSGLTAVIRKLRQLDFFPQGLVALGLTGELDEDRARRYMAEHPDEIEALEHRILTRGLVDPPVALDPSDPAMLDVRDIAGDDREFLVREISVWSGLSPEQLTAVDLFRPRALGSAGPDEPVLREAAE
jgi:hypothetical protein